MLEDIKNIMSSKRVNSDSKVACVQDTKTGLTYDVKTDSEFLFGRLLKSSIVIEELYISRSHSTIRFENDKFLLKDNNSCTGTYLNYKKINKEVVLQNGDLIAFTDKNKIWDFVYKFCIVSNPKKKLRLEEENSATVDSDKLKILIEQLQNRVKELKVDRTNILTDTKSQIDDLKKLVERATELNNKMNNSMIKLDDDICKDPKILSCLKYAPTTLEEVKQLSSVFKNMLTDRRYSFSEAKLDIHLLQNQNQKINTDLTICQRRCGLQKELLNTKIAKEEESVEIFKTQINKLLENDFLCAICNEVMFRPCIANCNHTFCETCLKTWLGRSRYCPTCRTTVHTTTYCLSLDNFITNLSDTLGGTLKDQRLTLQRERGHPPQVAKRGRRRMANQSNRSRGEPVYDLIDDDNTARNNSRFNRVQNVIEVVDLTNMSR